jgi:hypothetical protein
MHVARHGSLFHVATLESLISRCDHHIGVEHRMVLTFQGEPRLYQNGCPVWVAKEVVERCSQSEDGMDISNRMAMGMSEMQRTAGEVDGGTDDHASPGPHGDGACWLRNAIHTQGDNCHGMECSSRIPPVGDNAIVNIFQGCQAFCFHHWSQTEM